VGFRRRAINFFARTRNREEPRTAGVEETAGGILELLGFRRRK